MELKQLEKNFSLHKSEISLIITILWVSEKRQKIQNNKGGKYLAVLFVLCHGYIAQIPKTFFD